MIDFKALEKDSEIVMTQAFIVLRFDGVRFGTYTKDFNFPEDESFREAMDVAAQAALEEFNGLFAYATSDEITIVLHRETDVQQFYGGGRLMKLTSIGAGLLSASIAKSFPQKYGYFDGRGFGLDTYEEVLMYLESRRRSSVKNAIGMAASQFFTHKHLQGLHSGEREALLVEVGRPVDQMVTPGFLHGRFIFKAKTKRTSTFVNRRTGETQEVTALRTVVRKVACTPRVMKALRRLVSQST